MAEYRPETLTIVAGRPETPGASLSTPIVPVSASRSIDRGEDLQDNPYSRETGTPTWQALEAGVGALEGGASVSFSSGMSAVHAALGLAAPGVVLVPRVSYLGVRNLVDAQHSHGRWTAVEVDPTDVDEVSATMKAHTPRMLWLEVPSNPLLECPDVATLCAMAREHGALSVVDGTFASPWNLRALDHGADLSVQSATKLIGGHSDLLCGVVTARDEALFEGLVTQRAIFGATPGALEAFLATRGLRTLGVRVEHAQRTATALAQRLGAHPAVTAVFHPSVPGHVVPDGLLRGPGPILSFAVASGAQAEAVCLASRLVVHATSLGGVETTWERRSRYAANRGRIPDGLIRLSVGLEHVEDLWADIEQALSAQDESPLGPP